MSYEELSLNGFMQEMKEAVQYLESQTNLQNMYKKVVLSYFEGNYEGAVSTGKELIKLAPDNVLYHNILGIILHEMKRYDEALIEIQKAVDLEPDNALHHCSIGVILHEMKRYDEALVELQKVAALDPEEELYRKNYDKIKEICDTQKNKDIQHV